MPTVISYAVALVAFGALDAVWLTSMGPRLYRPTLGDILLPAVNWLPAVLFYLVYAAGLVVFAINGALARDSVAHAATMGALFGAIAYATYDLTNYATLRNWTLTLTLADMAWGALASAIAAAVSVAVTHAVTCSAAARRPACAPRRRATIRPACAACAPPAVDAGDVDEQYVHDRRRRQRQPTERRGARDLDGEDRPGTPAQPFEEVVGVARVAPQPGVANAATAADAPAMPTASTASATMSCKPIGPARLCAARAIDATSGNATSACSWQKRNMRAWACAPHPATSAA